MITFYGFVNVNEITDYDRRSNSFGSPVDQITLEFEASILNMLDDIKKEAPEDISTDFNVARSFSDQANEAVGTDVIALVIGFNVVYIYVLMMIGGFGCVQQKVSEITKNLRNRVWFLLISTYFNYILSNR